MIPDEDRKISGDDDVETIPTFVSTTSGGDGTASIALVDIYR